LLGYVKEDNARRWPRFFEKDYIPLITEFVRRPAGKHSIVVSVDIVLKERYTLTLTFSPVVHSPLALILIIPVWSAAIRFLIMLDVTHRCKYKHRWEILVTVVLSLSAAILPLVCGFNLVFFPRHSASKCLTFIIVTISGSVLITGHWSSQG
jgi:hypothetical protein